MSDSIAVPTTAEQPAVAGVAQARSANVWRFIRLVRPEITLGIVLAALGAVTSIGALLCIAPIIAALLVPQPDAAQISNLVILALVLTALTFTLRTLAFRISHMGAFRLEQILRTQLTEHLARVPLGYLVTNGAGALKKIVHDDVKALHAFVADSTPLMGRGYASPLVTVVALFIIDWRMALVALAVLPFGMLSMRLAMRDYATLSQQYNQANERINGAVIEFVQAMPVVRTFAEQPDCGA
ncbi:ABC transporter transmembrane domain-containing protein [Candidatus Viridilinea mediisalina]|uniref:ABC transporter transmembrane domain-containing protein n=1 Tax=Candidatus Viridilinea mediisalina TaxID=2024553 RepID=UPI001FE8D73A|nr:ABC transporter transmembrane domain-containing protein [Candidatus Viridilinea mediisalina]